MPYMAQTVPTAGHVSDFTPDSFRNSEGFAEVGVNDDDTRMGCRYLRVVGRLLLFGPFASRWT